MKSMNNIVKHIDLYEKKEETVTPVETKVVILINRLFKFFSLVCPGFDKQFHEEGKLENTKLEWARAFMIERLNSPRKLEKAVEKCRREASIYIPTIKQFMDWCEIEPQDLGLPSVLDAFSQACKNSHNYVVEKEWLHPVVHHAWLLSEPYRLLHLPRDEAFSLFDKNYKISLKRLRDGLPLSEITTHRALEAPTFNTMSEDKKIAVGKRIDDLKKMLAINSTKFIKNKNKGLDNEKYHGRQC